MSGLKGCPYYRFVPKDSEGNLRYRLWVLGEVRRSPELAAAFVERCRSDLLYYINTFVWTCDGRRPPGGSSVIPFVTFPFQDDVLLRLRDAIGRHDLLMAKSRAVGATWMVLSVFDWFWRFHRRVQFTLSSRTQLEVDNRESIDSLMPKLDFIEENLPTWLRVQDRERVFCNLFNPRTKSSILGASTTETVSRGGRPTAIMFDEFAHFPPHDSFGAVAASQYATNSRIFVSTPNGQGTAFHQLQKKLPDNWVVSLHWSKHPWQNRGLYTSRDGVIEILDKSYLFPPHYPFVADGVLRSPYYDIADKRSPSRAITRQELDIDSLGSGTPFFSSDEIRKAISLHACAPGRTGTAEVVPVSGGRSRISWRDHTSGKMYLWCALDGGLRPPRDRIYKIGVDVSQGSGASNSVLVVGDCRSGEKVFEYAESEIDPVRLAILAGAVGFWFVGADGTPAEIIFEYGAPGITFGQQLQRLEYPNLYSREREDGLVPLPTKKFGVVSDEGTKQHMLREYARAVSSGEFLERSEATLKEWSFYHFSGNGSVSCVRARTGDPSDAGKNHGDRVMASALLWKIMAPRMKGGGPRGSGPIQGPPPPGSFAWRMAQWNRKIGSGKGIWLRHNKRSEGVSIY